MIGSPVHRPHHHHDQAEKEHEHCDPIDPMHEADAQVGIRLLEQRDRIKVVKEAFPEHRRENTKIRLEVRRSGQNGGVGHDGEEFPLLLLFPISDQTPTTCSLQAEIRAYV